MKAETVDYLAKAQECLAGAKQIASLPLPHVAAREAYLAAYHAAEAYIFERTNKTVKTHRGLRTTFSRLARNEPRIAPEYLTFLARPTSLNRFQTMASARPLARFPARNGPPVSGAAIFAILERATGRRCVAIPNIQPQRTVLPQHPTDLPEYRDHMLDEQGGRRLQPQ